jgi:hypothetical protein
MAGSLMASSSARETRLPSSSTLRLLRTLRPWSRSSSCGGGRRRPALLLQPLLPP